MCIFKFPPARLAGKRQHRNQDAIEAEKADLMKYRRCIHMSINHMHNCDQILETYTIYKQVKQL